jgi:hypothetical protein
MFAKNKLLPSRVRISASRLGIEQLITKPSKQSILEEDIIYRLE